MQPVDDLWVAEMRAHYGQDGTHVIIDAMPTADCDPDLAYFQQHVNAYIDNKPYTTIPIEAFSTEGHLHVNKEGMNILSNMVANQILALVRPAGGN
jgi:hypothetical protein